METAQDRAIRRGTSVRIVIGSEVVGSLPHSYASKCAGRETKARYYMPYEQPLGEGARRRRRIDVPRRGTLLRSGQYDKCAKRYSVSSFRAKQEIFVIRGLAVNDWKFQTGNLLSTYLRASPYIYCSEAATTTLNPEPRNPKPETRNLFPFENDPHKTPLTQRRQTDTITHA